MSTYHVRAATLDDVDALIHHRLAMFADMGVPCAPALDEAFRSWLRETMPAGVYRAWVVESEAGEIVAGGGITILPCAPGPQWLATRMAFVYNVYTEAGHRRRGLARLLMEAVHDWCRQNGVGAVGLNASRAGQPLYEAMGYRLSPSPMMVIGLHP